MNTIGFGVTITGFESLHHWVKQLPDQTMGDPCAICQMGEPYVELLEQALSRPDDIAVIEIEVARKMLQRMATYLEDKSGRIYWRIPLETVIESHQVVVRYDANGPDIDFITDRKCFVDKNWKRVAAYCRLYRATHQTMVEEKRAAA
jgi:hypothetical protein